MLAQRSVVAWPYAATVGERRLIVGAAVPPACPPHLITIPWPAPLMTHGVPVTAVLPPANTRFDHVQGVFLTALLPQAQWPAVVAELVARVVPGGEIAFTDAPLIDAFPPASVLAAVEALTRLVTDALHAAPFIPARIAALLARTPGVVASTITTTPTTVWLGARGDPLGADAAAWWVAQRQVLLPLFARFGLVQPGERYATALTRAAHTAFQHLTPPVPWPISTVGAQVAPAWHGAPAPPRWW